MNIFIKVVDEAVSEKQLSAEIAKAKSIEIKGKSAEQIVKNLKTLLNGKDSLKITAGAGIFSNEVVLMEEIFDIFEEKEINDSAYYYQTHQSKKISKFIAEVALVSKLKEFNSEPRNFAGIFLVLIFL